MLNQENLPPELIDKLYVYISAELKHQRKIAGKNQGEIADFLGVSRSEISKIESGKRKSSPLYTFLVLSNYYGLSLEKLINNARMRYSLDYPDDSKIIY